MVMAGEIQQPWSLSFQADSLHSGSISFGRFETEALCWERRSSFSHNRYLEEVEKYSKPGSVIEKKAYFEAHFKKKALQSQSSSESQNGTELQTSENELSDDVAYREGSEHVSEDCYIGSFDTGDKFYAASDCVPEYIMPLETHQTETRNFLSVNAETERETKVNLNDAAKNGDVTSTATDPSPSSYTVGENDCASSEHQQTPFPKVTAASEMKPLKTALKSRINVTEIQRNESSNDSTKKPSTREREGSLRTLVVKKSSRAAAPTTHLITQASTPKDCRSSRARENHENKSQRVLGAKKVVKPQHFEPEKVVPTTRQTVDRHKQTVNSTKLGVKHRAPGFSFRSDEQAERRKEFFVKLEEKVRAKETQINQIQAQTLAVSRSIKSIGPRSKASSPGIPNAARSSSHEREGKAQSSNESVNRTHPLQALRDSETTRISPTLLTNVSHSLQSEISEVIMGKKEREKEKDMNFQRHRILEGKKVTKGQKAVEKPRTGAESTNGTVKKLMKLVDIGSGGSRIGHPAIGVAF